MVVYVGPSGIHASRSLPGSMGLGGVCFLELRVLGLGLISYTLGFRKGLRAWGLPGFGVLGFRRLPHVVL